MIKILIKFHNFKMLMTLDLNTLVAVLLDNYGENIVIEFQVMTIQEQSDTVEIVDEINLVLERFWVFECFDTGRKQRRKDLEEQIIQKGVK